MKYLMQNEDISIRKMEDNMQDYNHMTTWLSTEELQEGFGINILKHLNIRLLER